MPCSGARAIATASVPLVSLSDFKIHYSRLISIGIITAYSSGRLTKSSFGREKGGYIFLLFALPLPQPTFLLGASLYRGVVFTFSHFGYSL